MNQLSSGLAALVVDLPKQNRGSAPAFWLRDMLLILGLGLGLLLILASTIYLWKRLQSRRRRHISDGEKVYRNSEANSESAEEAHDEDEDEDEDDSDHNHRHHGRRRYKYRVRRRTHRSRNPTLSETGGLPPVKDPESKAC